MDREDYLSDGSGVATGLLGQGAALAGILRTGKKLSEKNKVDLKSILATENRVVPDWFTIVPVGQKPPKTSIDDITSDIADFKKLSGVNVEAKPSRHFMTAFKPESRTENAKILIGSESGILNGPRNATFIPGEKLLASTESLAHEVGHGVNAKKFGKWYPWKLAAHLPQLASLRSAGVGYGTYALGKKLGLNSEESAVTSAAASALAEIAAAKANLAEEFNASKNGLKLLHQYNKLNPEKAVNTVLAKNKLKAALRTYKRGGKITPLLGIPVALSAYSWNKMGKKYSKNKPEFDKQWLLYGGTGGALGTVAGGQYYPREGKKDAYFVDADE